MLTFKTKLVVTSNLAFIVFFALADDLDNGSTRKSLFHPFFLIIHLQIQTKCHIFNEDNEPGLEPVSGLWHQSFLRNL